ncbi:hypothetical protein BH23VER1_BH23VER1_37510 [soil metagenome]
MDPFLTDEHRQYRRVLRQFVETEISPFVNEWDEAQQFPRELYLKAGALGYWSNGVDERYGGFGSHDPFLLTIQAEEMARCGQAASPPDSDRQPSPSPQS